MQAFRPIAANSEERLDHLKLNNSRLVSICVSAALAIAAISACSRNIAGSQSTPPTMSRPTTENNAAQPRSPEAIRVSKQASDFYGNGDFEKAIELWRPLAEQGDAEAQRKIGSMYATGQGIPNDDATAALWFHKAAEQGDAQAQLYLGSRYASGQGVVKDQVRAAAWYRKSADQGFPQAQLMMGFIYSNGRGVTKDEAQVVAWYRKAADQGNSDAQTFLGDRYSNGQGVGKDDAQAVEWYRKAADQGNARAQAILGYMYVNGQGVAQNRAQAITWYRKAADQGDAEAKSNLDAMFADGQGFFAVYVRGGNQYELSDEPVSTCVHLKGWEESPWKVGLWTSRWSGKVQACWHKAHYEKERAAVGYQMDGKPSFMTLPAHDEIVFCLPYVRQKGISQPSCTHFDPEFFTAIDSLPRRAF